MLNQNPIFIMSLTGSVAFLLYKLWYPIAVRFFPPQWRRDMLILTMAFFLLPLPLWKYWMLGRWQRINPYSLTKDTPSIFLNMNKVILSDHAERFLPFMVKLMYIVTSFSAIIPVIMMLFQFYKYLKVKQRFLSSCKKISNREFQIRAKQSGIHRMVSFYVSDDVHSPFTLGILHPVIVIPSVLLEDIRVGAYSYLLTHELTHIKNWDSLTKILSTLTLCVHWFNPACYLMRHEVKVICEICCDAEVTKSFTDTQKHDYFLLVLSLASAGNSSYKTPYTISFINGNYNLLKRRIQEMKNFNYTYKKGLACLATLAICTCAMPTALAYSDPIELQVDSIATHLDFDSEEFAPKGEVSAMEDSYLHLSCDSFFTDEDGNVYEDTSSGTERIKCNHSYIDGTQTAHKKDSTGGCTVYQYDAKRCTICGTIIVGDLQVETRYKVCPH